MSYTHVITNAQTGEVTVVPFTPEEVAAFEAAVLSEAWVSLRIERDDLLAGSDWTQVADAPVDKAAWASYRQELRSLPQNTTDPLNPVWPVAPT